MSSQCQAINQRIFNIQLMFLFSILIVAHINKLVSLNIVQSICETMLHLHCVSFNFLRFPLHWQQNEVVNDQFGCDALEQ
jgi:hypothetical protein